MDDPIHKERHQTAETGVVLALVVGEVTSSKLTFGDSQKARLGLTVSTPVPSSFVGNNQNAFLTNRFVFWGKQAEELGRKVVSRDFENKVAGTKIVIFSSRFGQRKVKDNEYTHEFTGSGYRIIEDFSDVIEMLSDAQEEGIIPVTKVLTKE
jgi:hypothetical protein